MIIAIQQPEHLPWLGFFNKLAQCDLFVYLDNVQFKKRYFENRNRIKTKDGIKWLTIPVVSKGKYTQHINQVLIDNSSAWGKKYLGLLENTYRKHPYWQDIRDIIFPCIDAGHDTLADLNLDLIKRCNEYLQINTPSRLASTLGIDACTGSDLILEICMNTKADTYLSGPDGRNYLTLDKFSQQGINISYHDLKHPVYPQPAGEFESHMSIIDVIANCGAESSDIIKDCYQVEYQ